MIEYHFCGSEAICSGAVTVYPARGELQMVVENLVVGGQGDLQAAFEALKQRLAGEGLFSAERKRPLPPFPRSVGIVTSASGAAIQDIFNVMRRRAPGVRLLLRPVRVQGDGAAEEIAEAVVVAVVADKRGAERVHLEAALEMLVEQCMQGRTHIDTLGLLRRRRLFLAPTCHEHD